jgi:N-acetylmuramoyl-L-alanine amidase
VTVSDETKNALNRALAGEDISGGALYFVARKYADGSKISWFENNLKFLFNYGGHEFYTSDF